MARSGRRARASSCSWPRPSNGSRTPCSRCSGRRCSPAIATTFRERLLVRDISVFPRGQRLRGHPADPAGHHRRPNPVAPQGVAGHGPRAERRAGLARGVGQHAAGSAVAARRDRMAGGRGRARTAVGEPRRVRRCSAVPPRVSWARSSCVWSPARSALTLPRSRCSAASPFATRWRRSRRELPGGFAALLGGDARVAIGLLEPGGGWSASDTRATVQAGRLSGTKAAVEHALDVDYLAVVALVDGEPALALVPADARRRADAGRRAWTCAVPLARVGVRRHGRRSGGRGRDRGGEHREADRPWRDCSRPPRPSAQRRGVRAGTRVRLRAPAVRPHDREATRPCDT